MTEMFEPPAASDNPETGSTPAGPGPAIPMPPVTTPSTEMVAAAETPAAQPIPTPDPQPAPGTPEPGAGQPTWSATQPVPTVPVTAVQPVAWPPATPPGGEPPAQPYPWPNPTTQWSGGGWVPPGSVPPPGYGPGGAAWMPPVQPAPRHPHRTNRVIATAAVATLAVVVGTGAGLGIGYAAWQGSGQAPSNQGSTFVPPAIGNNGGSGTNPFSGGGSSGSGGSSGLNPFSGGSSGSGSGSGTAPTGLTAKVDPALVDINTTLSYQGAQAAGTGVVLTSNGEVLTNNHVVNGATSISVTDIGNGQTYKATVVGYDRTSDIAVIKLQGASGLQTANVGNSDNASVGDSVVGIGNAGGTGGTPSAATGTITALNQSITASDESGGNSEQLTGLIQTNADIQPGDSGGPLVNASAQVIGIDTAASSTFQFSAAGNTGFAIPINRAVSLANQIENGQASSTVHIGATGFLGVEVSDPSSNGLGGTGGSGTTSGASVVGVVSGGPAAQAGLTQGDTITSFDGHSIGSASDLTQLMTRHHPGDSVSIEYTDSSGNSHSATVQLTGGPPQ